MLHWSPLGLNAKARQKGRKSTTGLSVGILSGKAPVKRRIIMQHFFCQKGKIFLTTYYNTLDNFYCKDSTNQTQVRILKTDFQVFPDIDFHPNTSEYIAAVF